MTYEAIQNIKEDIKIINLPKFIH